MTRFGVPPKCRNHYFYRVKSFRGRCTQKWSSKRGPKNVSAEQALYKNVPLGGPQINPRPFCGRQTSENVVFRERGVFGKMPILHSSAVLGRTPPTKYSQGFLDFSRGGQKTGKNQCFLVVSCGFFFFLCRLLMVTCRLDIPSCLQMCHSSLLSYF